MRLTENKEYTIDNNIFDRLYWKEDNILKYNCNLWDIQKIDIGTLTTSTYLIGNICNEINR
jgi:hypothetical protein